MRMYRFVPIMLITRLIGRLSTCRWRWFSQCFIRCFARYYGVSLSDARVQRFAGFACFEDFFIRRLRPDARPVNANPDVLVSPVDGAVSELGRIEVSNILQAKSHYYSVHTLLADDPMCDAFLHGSFATLYLAPKDYHRVHMPHAGKLIRTIYVPGRLLPVKPSVVNNIPNVFAHNERVICLFDCEFGPMALVMVGAMIVGKMTLAWQGDVSRGEEVVVTDYQDKNLILAKGDEVGYFALGSSVVLCFPPNAITWKPEYQAQSPVVMGREVADVSVV